MVEFLHHQKVGGKIPPCRIHLFWWNFPPSASRWKNLRQHGGIFPLSPSGWKKSTMPYGGILPPSARRWNNSTLSWQAFVCFLTQSVQLTLSSVQLTLLECVMWSSKMSWNRGKNEQICTVKFQNFRTPILGRGYGAPPRTLPPPSALPCFAPLCLARGRSHRPSLCVVDILRYFRPCYTPL